MAPEVTAVIPTRNRREILSRTLDCALSQRDVDLEVIVVDEGSSDDTPAYLASIADARLRVVRHDVPKGLPAARNTGLADANGRWVAFCDDDDLWAPTKLRTQIDACEATGWRWSVTGVLLIDLEEGIVGHGRARGGDLSARLPMGNVVPGGGSAVLADRVLVEELGGFDETLPAAEDYDMWIRLGLRSPLAAVDRPLGAYRVWRNTMSSDTRKQRVAHEQVCERYRSTDLSPEDIRKAELGYRRYLVRSHLRHGDRRSGFTDYLDMARTYRQPNHVVHAVGALVSPGLSERWRAYRELAQVPAEWKAEGEAWLAESRASRTGSA